MYAGAVSGRSDSLTLRAQLAKDREGPRCRAAALDGAIDIERSDLFLQGRAADQLVPIIILKRIDIPLLAPLVRSHTSLTRLTSP